MGEGWGVRKVWVIGGAAVGLGLSFVMLLVVGVYVVAGNLLVGLSFGWWVDKHNRHHSHPNHEGQDPDIGDGVLAFTTDQIAARHAGLGRFIARSARSRTPHSLRPRPRPGWHCRRRRCICCLPGLLGQCPDDRSVRSRARHLCLARRPLCEKCVIADICKWPGKTVAA